MEDRYDLELKNKYYYCFNFKVFFIPSIVVFPLMFIFQHFQNDFYLFFCTFISLFILTWNFPFLYKITYMRPIYFEDLDDNNIEPGKKIKKNILYNIELSKKFKDRFIIYQQLLTSITFAITVDYLYYRFQTTEYQLFELLGFLGGVLSLFTKVIKFSGRIMLSIFYRLKKREKEKLLEQLQLDL
jgi:hypothetical protein